MRRNLKNLRLRAIAAVDNPCQEHAKALVIKSAATPHELVVATLNPLAKYICQDDGAHTFAEVLADNKFDENVWPCVDALSQSIRSIVGDSSLAGGDREAKISASVNDFLTAIRDISPEVSKQLEPLLVRKRDANMPKTVEELQADVTKLEGQVTDLTSKLSVAEKAAQDAMSEKDKAEAECKTAKAALDEATKAGGDLAAVKAELVTTKAALVAASDEIIKVSIDGTSREIKKSVVGDDSFAMFKAQESRVETAELEKRAGEDFPHVPGTAAEKAQVLKLVNGLPVENPARKSLEAILTSAEKMAAGAFSTLGGNGGATPTEKAARATFDQKVDEIAKRDSSTRSAAMSKARTECPTEFAAAYPDQADEGATAQ